MQRVYRPSPMNIFLRRLLGPGMVLALVLLEREANAAPPATAEEARSLLKEGFSAEDRSIVQIKMDRVSAYRKGEPGAPVVMLEFTDFGCSRCQAFYLTTYPR